jgi:hypothetical protein
LEALVAGGRKREEAFRKGWQKLSHRHGTAVGLFTGDDHLAGRSPSQGVLTEAVLETMESMETLLWAAADPLAGDILEKLAFNALPALFSADRRAVQRVQQVNQIALGPDVHPYYNAPAGANAFVEDAALWAQAAQGLPHYAMSLWMAAQDGGLAAMGYAPCTVRWRLGEDPLRVQVETGYPQKADVRLRLFARRPLTVPLHLRIPAWAKGAALTLPDGSVLPGEPGTFLRLELPLDADSGAGTPLHLCLPMPVRTECPDSVSVSVERGPILFALPVEDAASAWNVALLPSQGLETLVDEAVRCRGVPTPLWTQKGRSAAPPPRMSAAEGPPIPLTLRPYARTPLRIAQFPCPETERIH